jgi:hypothetical protein
MTIMRHGKVIPVLNKVVSIAYFSNTPRRRIEGVDIQLHAFLTSAVDEDE